MARSSDNFNRADGSPGSAWGSGIFNIGQISRNVWTNAAASSRMRWEQNSFGNDQFSEARFVGLRASLDDQYVIVRASSSLSNFYSGGVSSSVNSNKYHIREIPGASLQNTSQDPVAGDLVRLTAVGTTITLYVNGIQIAQATDATITTGQPGLWIGDSSVPAGGIVTMDDWLGGDFPLVDNTTPSNRLGIFSKESVLAVGGFDTGIPIAYGLFDDDFVAQFSGTVYNPNGTQMASVPWGVFSKDATLDGAFDA